MVILKLDSLDLRSMNVLSALNDPKICVSAVNVCLYSAVIVCVCAWAGSGQLVHVSL